MLQLAFVINAHNDPLQLTCCLASLKSQWTNSKFTIQLHVADNSDDKKASEEIKILCKAMGATWHKGAGDISCYKSLELVSKSVKADWLCFPSSDGYYVSGFSIIMLETAVRCKSDFVYCDVLYDPRLHGRGIYSVLNTFPESRFIDKTCFIIKKSIFKGFPPHAQDWRDGALVDSLVKKGYRMDKAKGCLVVHN